MPDDFDARVEPLPTGGAVLHVEGDLDMATTPRVEEALGAVENGSQLVIDLTACTFLDSTGVRALMAAAREAEAAGGRLALVATDPGLLRVLEIAGVDTLLPVHATVEGAL